MSDLIKREDAIDTLEQRLEDDYLDGYKLLKCIKDLPSAESERTAKVDGAGFGLIGHCHDCGTPIMSCKWKYCPSCGCKLDWSNDE